MHDRTNPSGIQAMPPAGERAPTHNRRAAHTPTATTSPAPWTRELDPDRAVTELSNRFPEATIWFGEFTGNYWALARAEDGTPHLIEGNTPQDLSRRLGALVPRTPQHHRLHLTSHRTARQPAACSSPATRTSSTRRPSRGRARWRGRHSATRTLSRSS